MGPLPVKMSSVGGSRFAYLHTDTHGFPSAPCMFKFNSSIDSKGCALNFAVGWLHVSLVGLDVCWVRGILKTLLLLLFFTVIITIITIIIPIISIIVIFYFVSIIKLFYLNPHVDSPSHRGMMSK